MPTNNLTPQLNAVQLKANIDALQKGGMKTTDIQSYVNNYKADGKGGGKEELEVGEEKGEKNALNINFRLFILGKKPILKVFIASLKLSIANNSAINFEIAAGIPEFIIIYTKTKTAYAA